ncbi:MAG: hypothetical protein H6672_04765 [Anaerolineaceae bacterium]|nr:hypothetical protein [Anaerolineaceae bacterium]
MKRIRRFFMAITALVIFIVVLVAVLFGLIGSATQPVVATANDFLTAIQKSDLQAAYDRLTPAKQAGLSLAAFTQTIPPGSLSEWRLPNQSVSTTTGQGTQGEVSGTAVFGGVTYRVAFTLNQVDGTWRIAAYTFTPG